VLTLVAFGQLNKLPGARFAFVNDVEPIQILARYAASNNTGDVDKKNTNPTKECDHPNLYSDRPAVGKIRGYEDTRYNS
jgi:hypothetical protein